MSQVKTYKPVLGGSHGPVFIDKLDAVSDIVEDIFEAAGITLTPGAHDVIVAGLATMIPDNEATYAVGTDYEMVVGSMDREAFENLPEHNGY